MQKSGFPKMHHHVGFSQIGSHIDMCVFVLCVLVVCVVGVVCSGIVKGNPGWVCTRPTYIPCLS